MSAYAAHAPRARSGWAAAIAVLTALVLVLVVAATPAPRPAPAARAHRPHLAGRVLAVRRPAPRAPQPVRAR